jgi:multiple sugar transport system permease protein
MMKVGHGNWKNSLFIAPYMTVFVVMLIFPLLLGMWLSLHKVDLFGPGKFIGLSNYRRLFSDDIFLQTIWNTVYFVFLTVPPLVLIGLFLAMALNKPTRTASTLRAIFFGSSVLSVTIVTLIWRIVLIPGRGLMSNIFTFFGLEPIGFLSTEGWAMISLAVATIWWCIGLPMMLFLSALQQIPKETYEAAALDNASRWRTFSRITLPSILRTIVLAIIIEIVLQFQLFGQAQLMTHGGPDNTTRPIVLFIYETGFHRWDVGYAAAAAEVLFVLILCAAMVQYFVTRRKAEGM